MTAQRRGENLQKVPISITSVSSKSLESAGISSTTDIMRVAPGLQFQQSIGLATPYIRGLGISGAGVGLESSVATFVDGVYLASGGDALLSLNNIDRIEVLRGPQGTLYGRNSTGGLVNIVTRTPQHKTSVEAGLSYDQWETITASGYVTGGLTDTVAADLAVRYSHQGQGWGTNQLTGQEVNKVDHDIAVRTKFLIEPSDRTKIVLAADYSDFKGSTFIIDTIFPGSVAIGGYRYTGPAWGSDSTLTDPFRASRNRGAHADVTQDLGFASFRSITAFRQTKLHVNFDPGSLPTPVIYIDTLVKNKQFSEELQLISPRSSPVKWIAGLYYFHNNSNGSAHNVFLFPALTGAPGPIVSRQDLSNRITSLAAFAQATVPITDKLSATAGGRITRDKFTYYNTTSTELTFVPPPADLSVAPRTVRGDTQTKPTWRLALDYQFSPTALVYASYSRGFRSGGYDAYDRTGPLLRPEIVDSYEAGTKLELFDRHVRFNTSAFYWKAKNLQVTLLLDGQSSLRNAAAADAYGLEAELTAAPVTGLTLTAGVSYLHARYKDFVNSLVSTPLPGGGNLISGNGDASGNQTSRTPDKTLTLSANYTTALAGGQLDANAVMFWSARWYADPENRLYQPSYKLVSGQLSWTEPSGHFRFRVFGRNLTNSKVAAQMASLSFGDVWQLTEPRTIGGGVDVKF